MGYTTRSTGLGDDADTKRAWIHFVRVHRGVVTKWPFQEDDYFGQPTARYTTPMYDALVRNGLIAPENPAQSTRDKAFVFVLAPVGVLSSNFVALGDYGLGDAYHDWANQAQTNGWSAVAWPFSTGIYGKYYGQWATKFTGQQYADAVNNRLIDPNLPTQGTPNNQSFYVLAPDDVQQSGPKTMGLVDRAKNAIFSAGDTAATKLGLPSLAGIEAALQKSLGVLAIVAAVGAFVLLRGRAGPRNFD